MGCCCSKSEKKNREEEKKAMIEKSQSDSDSKRREPWRKSQGGDYEETIMIWSPTRYDTDALKNKRDQRWRVKKEESNRDIAATTAPRDGGIKMTKSKAANLASMKRPKSDLPVLKFDPALETEASTQLGRVINTLAVKLYKEIGLQHVKDNVVFSPLSIAASLGLAELGATDNTRREIQRLIGPIQSESISYGRLYGDLQDLSRRIPQCGGEIKIANTIFVDSQLLAVRRAFAEDVERWFAVKIPTAPMSVDSKGSRRMIDEWVRDKTDGKIQQIIRTNRIGSSLHLVNGIYVKTKWQHEFRSGDTRRMTFYEYGSQKKEVEYIRQGPYTSIPYADLGDLQVIEMPCKAADICSDLYSMYFLLSKRRDGIGEIEKRLTPEWLMKVVDAVRPIYRPPRARAWYEPEEVPKTVLLVELPKFSVCQNIDMMPIFHRLGFRTFDHFERMSDDRRAQFSGATHHAFLEIDQDHPDPPSSPPFESNPEYLTLQPAFTRNAKPVRKPPPAPTQVKFTCDHPFLFVIVHKWNKSILLMGKVNRIEDLK